MNDNDVVNCIVCLKPAVMWTGHLLEYLGQHIDDAIGAGFCKEHSETLCPNSYGNLGCFGLWKKEYGKRNFKG